MILYDNDLDADAYPARLLLSLLGVIDCDRVLVDRFPGNQDPPVPVLVDGDAHIHGSAPVLRHLAARYAQSWLPLAQGAGEAWLAAVTSPRFAPRQARLLALFTAGGPPPGLIEEATARLQEMDDYLTLAEFDGQYWFAGDWPTIVDVAAFGPAGLSYDCGVEHDAFPALRRWIRRLRALPGFVPMPGIPQFY